MSPRRQSLWRLDRLRENDTVQMEELRAELEQQRLFKTTPQSKATPKQKPLQPAAAAASPAPSSINSQKKKPFK
jgi:hypothetical protein